MNDNRNETIKFMTGRRGFDSLGKFLLAFAAVCLLLFISLKIGIFYYLFLGFVLFWLFRFISKNIYKREDENRAFLGYVERIKKPGNKKAKKDNFRYFNCPKCGIKMRAPAGKGRIRVTCQDCGTQFETFV